MSAICRPDAYLARVVERCLFCRHTRRVLVRFFEYYDPYSTCCACGNQWGAGAPQRTRSKRLLLGQSVRARELWPSAMTQAVAIRAMLEAMTGEAPSAP